MPKLKLLDPFEPVEKGKLTREEYIYIYRKRKHERKMATWILAQKLGVSKTTIINVVKRVDKNIRKIRLIKYQQYNPK